LNVSRAVTPLSKLPVLPRCAIVAHLVGSGGARVSLASVHLTGGRFTDSRWRDFAGEKRPLPTKRIRTEGHLQTPIPPCRFEVETTVSLGGLPDVVVGDLNSYWNASDVVSHQKTYGPYITATEAGHEEGYVSWAMEGVLGLEALGYTRLPGINQDPGMRIWSSLKPRDLTHSWQWVGHDQIRWHRRPHLLDGRAAACQPNERHGDGPARRLRHLGPRRYLCNHPGEARRAGDCSQGCGRGVAAGSDGLGRPPDPGASGSSWCSVHVPGSVAEPEDALPIAGEAAAHARGGRSSRGVGRMHHQRPADGECRIVSTSQVRSVWCAEGARRLAA